MVVNAALRPSRVPAEAPRFAAARRGGAADQERREALRPEGWRNPAPAGRYQLVVIGAGTCGLAAARSAAAHGARVALVERDLVGGTCLNVGCVPSKALIRSARVCAAFRDVAHYSGFTPPAAPIDFGFVMRRVHEVQARLGQRDSCATLAAAGIDVFFGQARFLDSNSVDVDGTRLRFRKALVATGARPDLPDIPGLAEAGYFTNETIFDAPAAPRSLLVIGGGPLGCETAQALHRLGIPTSIVQHWPLFLPREERDAAQILSDSFAHDGITIRLNTEAERVRVVDGVKIVDLVSDGWRSSLRAEAILTGTGRVPNVEGLDLERLGIACDDEHGVGVDDHLRTANRNIYAAGDACLEYKFNNSAAASARVAVHNALFPFRRRFSALALPWCTYTDPEIAHVGLYVREANARGIPVKTWTVPMHTVDRAVADGELEGFVKIVTAARSDRIVGATIVHRHAGDMIGELVLALQAGIGLRQLAQVMHPYPTHAGGILMAARACANAQPTGWSGRLARAWLRWRR
jgi:pyruvate/2-oxoglutarate dehydrogenase complex dihydrolipoamide dehydrogenase (E3) component